MVTSPTHAAKSPGLLPCQVYELEEGRVAGEKVGENTPSSLSGVQAHPRSGDTPTADRVMPLRSGLAVARGGELRCGHGRSPHQEIQLHREAGMCDGQRQNDKNHLQFIF